jgi:hypothetical protein
MLVLDGATAAVQKSGSNRQSTHMYLITMQDLRQVADAGCPGPVPGPPQPPQVPCCP